MNSKILSIGGIISAASAAASLFACGQAAGPAWTPESESTTDALNTVIGCQTRAFACTTDAQAPAGFTSCNADLRACLASLVPDAGTRPVFPTPPRFDAGFQPPVLTPPSLDAGFPVRSFDAGFPQPPPVVRPDAGAASQPACLGDLQVCLSTTRDAAKCATEARACLTAANQARCDAQQAACTASGAPKALCDAERAICF